MVKPMDRFAFIIHPINPKQDVSRKFPMLGRVLNERQINFFSTFFPPVYISEITGIVSAASGKEIAGWFIACPLTPQRMMDLPVETVYRKIVQTGRMAEKLGAGLLGLGAFTSVVGDGGVTIADRLEIPVTTGDALTVGVAVEALTKAAQVMEIEVESATAAVVGATGAIGQVCSELLAEQVNHLILIGRQEDRVQRLRQRLESLGGIARITTSTEMGPLAAADLILTVTNDVHAVIAPEHLKSGCVICDVARPRDVSARVAAVRRDVLVIDGGMMEVPGPVDFHFNFGFPPGNAYACMAETMALTLEGRFEDYTLGKSISRQQVKEISTFASRHGFRLSGFRSFERAVTEAHISRVKEHIRRGAQFRAASL